MAFPTIPTNGQKYIDTTKRIWQYTTASKQWNVIEHNADALDGSSAIAPVASDDSSKGYSVGSHWIDTATGDAYINVDSTAGAAVWYKMSGGSVFRPLAADPALVVGDSWFNSTSNSFKGTGTTGVWNARPPMIGTVFGQTGAGSTTSMVSTAGTQTGSAAPITLSEIWNGTLWATTASCTVPEVNGQGTGLSSSAFLKAGGQIDGAGTHTLSSETFNGAAWTLQGNMTSLRSNAAAHGSSTAALISGGASLGVPNRISSESFNGTTWATSVNLVASVAGNSSAGTMTNAIMVGGYSPIYSSASYLYNGVSWSTTGNNLLAADTRGISYDGTTAICFGGHDGVIFRANTEVYNGGVWVASGANLIAARAANCWSAVSLTPLVAGGSPLSSATEQYTTSSAIKTFVII